MILDASVILKWFIEEEGSNLARAIKNDHIAGKLLSLSPILLYTKLVML